MISYLTDMDGVLHREGEIIPGAQEFISALRREDIEFMRDPFARQQRMGRC